MADTVRPAVLPKKEDLPSSLQAVLKEYGRPVSPQDLAHLAATSPAVRCEALRMLYQGCQPAHIMKYLISMATTPDLTRQDMREAAAQVRRNSFPHGMDTSAAVTSAPGNAKAAVTPPPVVAATPTKGRSATPVQEAKATKRKATTGKASGKSGAAAKKASAAVDDLGLSSADFGVVLQRTNSSAAALTTTTTTTTKKKTTTAAVHHDPQPQRKAGTVKKAPQAQPQQASQRAVSVNTMISISPPSSEDDEPFDSDAEGIFLGSSGTGTSSHRIVGGDGTAHPNGGDGTIPAVHKPSVTFAPVEKPAAAAAVAPSMPTLESADVDEESSVRRTRGTAPPSNTARAISFSSCVNGRATQDMADAEDDDVDSSLPPTVTKRSINKGRGTFIGNPPTPTTPPAPKQQQRQPKSVSPGTAMAQTLQSRLHPQPLPDAGAEKKLAPQPAQQHPVVARKKPASPQPVRVTPAAAAHASAVVAAAEKAEKAVPARDTSPQVQPPANATMIVSYVDDTKRAHHANTTAAFHHATYAQPQIAPAPVEMAYTELSCGRSDGSPSVLPPLDFSGLGSSNGPQQRPQPQNACTMPANGTPRGAVMERLRRQGTGAYLSPKQRPSTPNHPRTSGGIARGSGSTGQRRPSGATPKASPRDMPCSGRRRANVMEEARSHTNTPRGSDTAEDAVRRYRQQHSAAWNETFGVYVTHPNKLRKLPSYSAGLTGAQGGGQSRDTAPATAFQRRPSNAAGALLTTPRSPRTRNADTVSGSGRGQDIFSRAATSTDATSRKKRRGTTGMKPSEGAAFMVTPRSARGAKTARARIAEPFSRNNTAAPAFGHPQHAAGGFTRSHTATAGLQSTAAAVTFARTASLNGWRACYDAEDGNDAAVMAGYIHSSPFGRLASARTQLANNNIAGHLGQASPRGGGGGSGGAKPMPAAEFAATPSFQRMASRYEDFNPNITSEGYTRMPSRYAQPQPLQRTASATAAALARKHSTAAAAQGTQHPYDLGLSGGAYGSYYDQAYVMYTEEEEEKQQPRSGRRFGRRPSGSAVAARRTATVGAPRRGFRAPGVDKENDGVTPMHAVTYQRRAGHSQPATSRGAAARARPVRRHPNTTTAPAGPSGDVFERLTSQFYSHETTHAHTMQQQQQQHYMAQPLRQAANPSGLSPRSHPRPLQRQETNTYGNGFQRTKSMNKKMSGIVVSSSAQGNQIFNRTASTNAGHA